MASDIENWLNELELGNYIEVFVEAEIDMLALPHLSDEDLKELGLPMGPRRKVTAAISQLNDSSPTSTPDTHSTLKTTPNTTSTAERRHLTVMFVDLVGSTEMAIGLDVEDMRSVITDYQNQVSRVIEQYEGFVARFMGDGVLCYFGWPRAREDDAERAVRAGLDIISGTKKMIGPTGVPLSTRVGVASGVVVVGDLIGSGASEEAAVVGETPNLAARLQSLADPDQLVVPQETRNLLGNLFELESLGACELKGIVQPVHAFAVTNEAASESRFDARQSGVLSPIVGRQREIRLIGEYWNRAQSGRGSMILVSGEAGIGKSRITRAIIDEISSDVHTRITVQCSPYHMDSVLHPIIAQIAFAAGFASTDDDSSRLNKLQQLEGVGTDNLVLLADMLDIDSGDRFERPEMTPTQRRAHTLGALIQIIVRLARKKPLLYVFEDLHWIDPTSLELLQVSLDAITEEKILILATARPTFDHSFGGHPALIRCPLHRLDRKQSLCIVEQLSAGKAIPDNVLQIITDRTDGVPLFIEELTRTVIETGLLRPVGDQYVIEGSLNQLAIPSTLHDSLMARLDRLEPIKMVAQTAACIGREFGYSLLSSITPLTDAELNSALDGLVKSELIYRRGLVPEATYQFKHALVRDAAYESLLKESRRHIHNRILESMNKNPNAAPEVLACHAEAAGLTDQAITFWESASKAAIARPAFDEAISHLEHAIALLPASIQGSVDEVNLLQVDKASLELALRLQAQLATAFLFRKGYGADETKVSFEWALKLTNAIGETPIRFPVLYGLWVNKYVRAQHSEALGVAKSLLEFATNGSEAVLISLAHRLVGVSLCLQGRFIEAQTHLDRAHEFFDAELNQGLENRFGQDLGVALSCYTALNLWLLGETQRAQEHAQTGVSAAKNTRHINTICYMHCHIGIFEILERNEESIDLHGLAISELSDEHRLTLWQHVGGIMRGLTALGSGAKPAFDQYLAADAEYVASKSKLLVSNYRIEAAFRALDQGLIEEAQRLASMARAGILETGEEIVLAELYRLEGALAREANDHNIVEQDLRSAISIAKNQGSQSFELRAAFDLENHWCLTGQSHKTGILLKPILEKISAGDCAEDVKRAQFFLRQNNSHRINTSDN